ncbi:MAG: hypothetical protein QM755_02580 [Luteolibacter sp.]
MAGVVGGTVSVIGGGKFANGAFTGAFQHLLNSELGRKQEPAEKLSPVDAPVRGGSSLGNSLAKLPILGYALGPIGDIVSGRPGFGISSFVKATVEDVYDMAIGLFYAKPSAILFNLKRGSMHGTILSVIIPHYGWMTGADWGLDPATGMDFTSRMGTNKLEYAARQHDYDSYVHDYYHLDSGDHHGAWISNVWFGPGFEPGPFGQGIRLIGGPVFALAKVLKF